MADCGSAARYEIGVYGLIDQAWFPEARVSGDDGRSAISADLPDQSALFEEPVNYERTMNTIKREKVRFASGATECVAWHYPGDNGAGTCSTRRHTRFAAP